MFSDLRFRMLSLLNGPCSRDFHHGSHPPCPPEGPTSASRCTGGAIVLELSSSVQSTVYYAMRLKASSKSRRSVSVPVLDHFKVDGFLSSSLMMDQKCAALDLPGGRTGDRPGCTLPIGLEMNLQLAEILRKREN